MSERPPTTSTTPVDPEAHRHARGALTGSRVLVARRVVVTGTSALSTAVIARSFTTDQFAVYSVALAAFFLATAVGDLGFSQVAGREMSQRPAARSSVMWSAMFVGTCWSLIVAAGFVGYAWWSSDGGARVALLVLVPALALGGLTVARQWFVVDYDVGWMARVDLALNLLQVALLVALALAGAGPVTLLAVVTAVAMANSGIVAAAVLRRIDPSSRRTRERAAVLRMALPIGIPSVLASAYFSVDLLIAASLLDADQVAQYAAAVKFLTMLAIVPQILMSMALPGFAALSVGASSGRLGELVGIIWHWLAAFGVPICVGIGAYASLATGLLFGPDYEEAAAIVRVLMLAAVISFASNVLGTLVIAQGLAGRMFYQNIVALGLTVGLNVWLLPIYGVLGAAWITVGIELFLASMSFVWLRRRCDWGPMVSRTVRPVVASATIILTALLPLGHGWAQLCLSVAVFAATMTTLGGWPFALSLVDLRRRGPRAHRDARTGR